MKTVVGLFDTFEDAQNAVRDLRSAGFSGDDISLVAQDEGGHYAQHLQGGEKQNVGDGAAAGAGIGAVLGGLGGLLLGLGALAIPGIGPILAAGPIVAALGGAGVGAIAGGIVGALVDLGIPEEHANMYAEGIRRGGTLVVARTSDEMADQAADVMNRYHPIDIDSRATEWREQNWTRFDENAGQYQSNRLQNQGSNIPVTGDQTDNPMGQGYGPMGDSSQAGRGHGTTDYGASGTGYDSERDFNRGARDRDMDDRTESGMPDEGFRQEKEFNRGSNFDSGTGSYGSNRDYNTPTGGVGDRGMASGEMDQESTASDHQHNRLNDQGQMGMGGTASDYDRGTDFTTGAGGTQNTGVTPNMQMDMDDDMDDDDDIPVTGGPDVLYSETVIEEDVQPVDDNWSYFDNRFRSDYSARHGSTGYDYSYYQPAYRFGYDLASNPQYRNWDWDQVEPLAREQWEHQGLRGKWEDFKDFVQDAWDRVTNG